MTKRFILEVTAQRPVLNRVDLYTAVIQAASQLAGNENLTEPLTANEGATITTEDGQAIGSWRIVASPLFTIRKITTEQIRSELESMMVRLGVPLTDAVHAMLDDMQIDLGFDLEAIDAAIVSVGATRKLADEEET